MGARLNPYLQFRGTARDAMTFYESVFGGTLTLMTFGESGGMGLPEDEQSGIMHGQLDVVLDDGHEFSLMGSDVPSRMDWQPAAGMTVALSGSDDALLRGWWDRLLDGATVGEPLTTAPWGDAYGSLTDRFGTPWMINIAAAQGS